MSNSTAPSPLLRLPAISLRWSVVLCLCMAATALLAVWATPKFADAVQAPSLDATVPRQFGDWKEVPSPFLQVSLTTGTETNMDQPYDQVVMRTYVNSQGEQIMLALAWGQRQKQEVKIHRPDLCYVAQGFRVRSLQEAEFSTVPGPHGKPVIGKRMYTDTNRFGEAVSYWMRIGSLYSESAVETRAHIFKEGLQGRIPDGILVRASMRVGSAEQAAKVWPTLESFTKQMVEATPEATRKLLLGPDA